jgi:hypothetical protein
MQGWSSELELAKYYGRRERMGVASEWASRANGHRERMGIASEWASRANGHRERMGVSHFDGPHVTVSSQGDLPLLVRAYAFDTSEARKFDKVTLGQNCAAALQRQGLQKNIRDLLTSRRATPDVPILLLQATVPSSL